MAAGLTAPPHHLYRLTTLLSGRVAAGTREIPLIGGPDDPSLFDVGR